MEQQERFLYPLLGLMLAAFLATGFLTQGFRSTSLGLWQLQVHPARLLNDFSLAAGEGAALVNASLVAAIGLLLVRVNRVRLSGPTVAAVFTMFGFGLFGTALGPLASQFGSFVGVVAGFLHLSMVQRTGAWHLGMNLYNNGFAGGLTATFLVAVIDWYNTNIERKKAGAAGSRAETKRGRTES